jgi:hypothetical protein
VTDKLPNIGEIKLVTPPQAEDIQETKKKKPRLEKPLPTTTAGAARKTASPDVVVGLAPPATLPSTDTVDASTLRRSYRPRRSRSQTQLPPIDTSEEELDDGDDANDAVVVVDDDDVDSEPVMDDALDPSIGRATARVGTWTADEDKMLKDAVLVHGGKNWETIATLVPGRAKIQCFYRWSKYASLNPATASTGKWTADEDKMLKDAVLVHGGNNWVAIAALVPGQTKKTVLAQMA